MNYSFYVQAQLAKTDRVFNDSQWVLPETLKLISNFVALHLPLEKRFALAHGTRSGREVVWFRANLPGENVWGTELSELAAARSPFTLRWDFHDARAEWTSSADFVYSNALDHAYNASLALQTWMAQLAPGGAVLVHWAGGTKASAGVHRHTDLFFGKEAALMKVFCRSADVERILRLPRPEQNWAGQRARRQVVYVLKAKNASQKSLCSDDQIFTEGQSLTRKKKGGQA